MVHMLRIRSGSIFLWGAVRNPAILYGFNLSRFLGSQCVCLFDHRRYSTCHVKLKYYKTTYEFNISLLSQCRVPLIIASEQGCADVTANLKCYSLLCWGTSTDMHVCMQTLASAYYLIYHNPQLSPVNKAARESFIFGSKTSLWDSWRISTFNFIQFLSYLWFLR
jgi:hypothetical protein